MCVIFIGSLQVFDHLDSAKTDLDLPWRKTTHRSHFVPVIHHLDFALVLYPGCMPAGLFAAADLLHAAALRSGARNWRVQWVGLKRGSVACAHGMTLNAAAALDSQRWDALLLPGFWASSPDQLKQGLTAQRPLLQSLSALGRKVPLWTWCTGVAIAAAAGRLDGKPATGTWWMAPTLSQLHPAVNWQWQQPMVSSPHLVTASGVHGYLSILNEQMEQRTSPEAWRDVQRLMVLPRPQPAASVFDALQTMHGADPLLARLRQVVERLPATQTTLAVLSDALACSPRTLARKVSDIAGMPVGRYVRLVKLHQAGEHLLLSGRSAAQVSDTLGFADESGFRRSFKTSTGMTPAEYVHRYRT
jgi:transcriptional regulator GlxA family with amidase domain